MNSDAEKSLKSYKCICTTRFNMVADFRSRQQGKSQVHFCKSNASDSSNIIPYPQADIRHKSSRALECSGILKKRQEVYHGTKDETRSKRGRNETRKAPPKGRGMQSWGLGRLGNPADSSFPVNRCPGAAKMESTLIAGEFTWELSCRFSQIHGRTKEKGQGTSMCVWERRTRDVS